MADSPARPLVEARGLRKTFETRGLLRTSSRTVAAWDVSLDLHRGEAVALVGESGSGKSTVARLLLRLEAPDGGEIRLDGDDVLKRERRRASLAYRRRVQMVFQDPFGSLNAIHTVGYHLARPLVRHRRADGRRLREAILDLLRTVGLEPAEEFIERRPYELSGGQRQRVAIARALAPEPDLLVADEPTSMLDVSIRMGILNLLADLKTSRRLAILLITHDLASARYLAERILVMYRGRVVEEGPSGDIVRDPAHPYTRALLSAIADAEGDAGARDRAPAEAIAHEGCPFAARCPEVFDACRAIDPPPRPVGRRRVRCHLYDETSTAAGGTR